MSRLGCMTDLWLFRQLPASQKQHLQQITRKCGFNPGDLLFLEDEPAASVFLVTEGRIKLFKVSEEGKEIILGFLTPHDLFGEEALFAESRRSMSAVALEPTRLCVCEKDDFENIVRTNPDFAMQVIQALGDKLHKATDQLAEFALHDVRNRIGLVLTRLAKNYGVETPRGLSLNFRLTHEDLGALVGASRVMVTQVLQELKKAGQFSTDGQSRFIVHTSLLDIPYTDREEEQTPAPPLCPCFNR